MKTFRHSDDPNIPGKNSLKEDEQIICFFYTEREFLPGILGSSECLNVFILALGIP